MGTTTIKRIENLSSSVIQVLNREHPTSHGANTGVGPGRSIEADMWIPGAPNPGDFAGHHLEIQQSGRTRYWIWQAANADGDFIRFSTDGLWHDQGERVHGYPGTAKNIFEAVGNIQNPNLIQRFGEVLLGDRALVVLDNHFEIIPISPKPPIPPLTTIKRIDNRSSKTVTVFNREKKDEPKPISTTASMAPLIGSADANMTIPWVVNPTDFREHRLEVRFDGVTRFWIWQEFSKNDGDYIRFATSDGWSRAAPRVKGTAVTGISPADLVFFGDRTMIVSDSGIELLPRPMLFDFLLDTIKPLLPSARRVAESPMPVPPQSVPKKSATAFSIAGPVSDAFKRGEPGARYLYTDSGKRYEFTINQTGTIMATDLDGNVTPLTKGWSYTNTRLGESVTLPPFDLIAASGGRVFAKAKGTDQFFLGSMDHMFIHASKGKPADAPEISIPGTSFKLDPQFGTGANPVDLAESTLPVPVDSPMSERFPVFHRIMHRELIDLMLARVDPEILYQLDYRPPQNVFGLAIRDFLIKAAPAAILVVGRILGIGWLYLLAPLIFFEIFKESISEALRQNAELGSAPLKGMPTYRPVTYRRDDGTQISPPVIKYERVLDIGVSHTHWFLQHNLAGGGEIQPLLHSASTQNIYRFFNGAVQDGDGFVDGTSNVYILVQHEPTLLRPHKFALLFLDEQWYFCQRWRLVDPDDNAGLLGGPIIVDLKSPEYAWNPDTYWCPFRNGHINDRSRLAVAAHVLLVTGEDRDTNVPRIYSINYSWATIDRTWRHRRLPLPPDQVSYFDQATIDAGNEPVQADTERVYPQTIRLREDMTIHLKGARNIEGRIRAGRWYQRYLPADNGHVPMPSELVAFKMPVRGYTHPWKFLPEHAFRLADSFSHFGVYDVVDSRCQYYDVAPASPADAATLDTGGTGPWIDERRQLYVSQWKFRYNPQRPGADPVEPPSLFHPDTRLRIIRRGSRWIATLWDKRDDDLLPFARLPMKVTLKNGTHTVLVTIGPHHEMKQPPMVRTAYMWLEPDGAAGIAFTAVGRTWDVVRDNVWRVRMAALEAFEDEAKHITRPRVVQLVDVTTEGTFTSLGSSRYERRWKPTAAELTDLRRYCSPQDATAFATSIWFEDIVGHVSVPDSLLWQRSDSLSTTASPRSIPLDRPIEVTVAAQDTRTQQPLDGEVRVNDEVVARTGQRFTHTFMLGIPLSSRSLEDGKPGPIEPTEPIPPVVSVAVKDYPAAIVDIEFFTLFSGAAFVRQTVPASMISGRTYSVSVTMRNNGTSTWTSGGPNPFRLGSQSPQDNSTWGGRRELPGPVTPGAEVTFGFDVVAPAPGMHHFQWRMLQELVEWFGALTTDVLVQVDAPPLPTLTVSVTPFPVPLNVLVSVTVRAVDSQTGAPVTGRVSINDIDVASTNTPFTFTFRSRRIGVFPNIQLVFPFGSVVAPGYEPMAIEFGFPEL